MQKSPPTPPFSHKNPTPLTISLLPHQRCQKPLEATLKPSRRQGEGRAKGERTMSVSSLNFKRLTTIPPLCIIRNKNPKTLHFPQPFPLIYSFSSFLHPAYSLTPIHYPLPLCPSPKERGKGAENTSDLSLLSPYFIRDFRESMAGFAYY